MYSDDSSDLDIRDLRISDLSGIGVEQEESFDYATDSLCQKYKDTVNQLKDDILKLRYQINKTQNYKAEKTHELTMQLKELTRNFKEMSQEYETKKQHAREQVMLSKQQALSETMRAQKESEYEIEELQNQISTLKNSARYLKSDLEQLHAKHINDVNKINQAFLDLDNEFEYYTKKKEKYEEKNETLLKRNRELDDLIEKVYAELEISKHHHQRALSKSQRIEAELEDLRFASRRLDV